MRQAIRAFGWAINIFWIILLFFAVTALYSVVQLVSERAFGFGESSIATQGNILIVSLPFYVNNRGFYDISDLSVTTLVTDKNGLLISNSSTPPQLIPHGSNVSVTHDMPMNISQMTTESLSYLLFNDSVFDVNRVLKLNYANVVPLKISTNFTMSWGAPLSNLTIGNVSVNPHNATHLRAIVPVSFENHSPFSLNGTMQLKLVDNTNGSLGTGTVSIPPQGGYIPIEVFASDLNNLKGAELYFVTSAFRYETEVIPLV